LFIKILSKDTGFRVLGFGSGFWVQGSGFWVQRFRDKRFKGSGLMVIDLTRTV
jgi:hypothetical protein